MIEDNRLLRRAGAAERLPRLGVAALCVLCAIAILALSTGSAHAATIVYEPVSETVFLHELDSGQVAAATINKRARSVRVTLKDGSYVKVKYPKHDEPHMYAVIKSHGVPVTILSATQAKAELKGKPVHHKLRYIIGGVLIVVIVIVVAVLLLHRRRRRREEEGE
jgi:translation initiation factor IF-1